MSLHSRFSLTALVVPALFALADHKVLLRSLGLSPFLREKLIARLREEEKQT